MDILVGRSTEEISRKGCSEERSTPCRFPIASDGLEVRRDEMRSWSIPTIKRSHTTLCPLNWLSV